MATLTLTITDEEAVALHRVAAQYGQTAPVFVLRTLQPFLAEQVRHVAEAQWLVRKRVLDTDTGLAAAVDAAAVPAVVPGVPPARRVRKNSR